MSSASVSIRHYPHAVQGWWAVAVFTVAAGLSYTDRFILGVIVDPLRAELHLSDVQIGILQGTAFAVLYSVIGLPFGRIADLVPRRHLLVAAVALWSLGTVFCGISHSFGTLFASRLLVGVGEAALAPAAMSLIGDYFKPEFRALPTGIFFTGMVAGGGGAIAVGGFLLSTAQHGAFSAIPIVGGLTPWRAVLAILGIAGFAVAALFLTLSEPGKRDFSSSELRSRLLALGDVFAVFRRKYALLLPLYGAMAIGSIVDYAILSWTPALLSRRFALTPGEIGAGLGGVAVAAALIGTPLGGALADWIAKRFGPLARIRLCAAALFAGLLAAPVGILSSPAATLAAVFLWIAISSLAGTIGIATTLDLLSQESRGLGTATIAFCNTLVGLGLGPTLVAYATEHVYGTPSAVGMALTTVVAPAILISGLLFCLAAVAARGNSFAEA
ncbi:MAG TPA: MFS transporter [Rhizomicrobium sp.]